MEQITVSKLDAARRQLDCAIALWFSDGDPVSIHTLASAARQILYDINQHIGPKVMDFGFDIVKEEYREELMQAVRAHTNFFKHANRNPLSKIEFKPRLSVAFMLYAINELRVMGEATSDYQNIFQTWHLLHSPELFLLTGEYFSEPIHAELRALPKLKYLEQTLSALALLRSKPAIPGH